MATTAKRDRRLRGERLGFRVDEPTKALIERAAQLERRKLTDFCMTALTEAARRTIAKHETLVLSDRDRAVFFDALVNPPTPNKRLQRALAEHRRRVVPWMAKRPSEDLRIVLLGEEHDRGSFSCGVESLDRYPKTQAGQDVRRKANAVFILSGVGEPTRILGYYTLCAVAIAQGDVPEAARKHVARYPMVSATLIGRLAVAKDRQGQRLGAVLLADALQRAFESASTVGSSMAIVDALDETAAGFYAAHGFVRLPDSLRLVLPMRLAGGSAERWDVAYAAPPAPGGSKIAARDGRDQRRGAKRKARCISGPSSKFANGKNLGAGEGIRTLDPDLGKVVLYHWATPASERPAATARQQRQSYAKCGSRMQQPARR
jgi:uncharacterized protein (DUF1778 family)/GNAT superfamily N-acetyltransferase